MSLNLKILISVFIVSSISCSQQKSAPITMENPLPPCPESPNCDLRSYEFQTTSTKLTSTFVKALETLNAHEISESNKDSTIQIDAVFKIPVFGWLDDVTILIASSDKDSSLTYAHLRSASREGYSDLGVNKRRLNKIYKNVHKELNLK